MIHHQSSLAPNANQPFMVQQQFYQPPDTHHLSMVHHQSYQAPAMHQPSQASFPPMDSGLAVPSFLPSDDPIASLNKAMAFISTTFALLAQQLLPIQQRQIQGYTGSGVRSSATGSSVNRNGVPSTLCPEKAMLAEALESRVVLDEEQMAFLAYNKDTVTTYQESQEIPTPAIFQTDDLDAFDSDCDEASSASVVLMAKHSAYDLDVLLEVLTHDTYLDNQVIDKRCKTENEIVQDASSSAQQDALMSMIEEMSNQKYKVADSQNQIHSLKLQLSATVESHKTLSTTVDVLKKEYKAKEDKYLKEIIGLEKKKKALDNVVYKMSQSTQMMHMLTKPQAFYDESHKIALGYQNPLYLTQAQRKVHALYCGRTIVKKHDELSIIDTEEMLELAEESRLKMHTKQNDPIAKDKKVNIAPIDYAALNKLSEHFVKHFVPQK
ncbi:hypothetical protein Tco_1304293 [Tanacetum coccineum]